MCATCALHLYDDSIACCHVCGLPAVMSQACEGCMRHTDLDALYVLGLHENELRSLVAELKFRHARQIAADIAPILKMLLPVLPDDALIVHLPTSHARARQRGFDQAELLARELARITGMSQCAVLRRHGNTRQVGASRRVRFEQAKAIFSLHSGVDMRGKTVLVVDDVVTTGASMEAAARELRAAGATQLFGLAIARGRKIGKQYSKITEVRDIISRAKS